MGGLPGFPRGGPAAFAFEKPFPVVRLRGLPFNANELDIFEFFQVRRGREAGGAIAGHFARTVCPRPASREPALARRGASGVTIA